MKVIKRNGAEVEFDIVKIIAAVTKANAATEEDARMTPVQIQRIAESVELACQGLGRAPTVEEIQDFVEHQIMAHGAFEVAKRYITYRYTRSLVRKSNTTDDKILTLIECNNEEAKQENSNKNPVVNSTQRDYMAGEVSRDLTNRILLPEDIVKAHEEGIIHFHDTDYYAQHMHNCDLVNLEDMLQNGTVITGTLIERPHSFATACNIATQIVAQVASNQYGGDIQHRIGWLLLGMLVISAVLVYFVGRLYATRMVDRIDAAYQSEKSFISNASHELNNPLTAIQGECEISLLKERTSAEYQAALGRIASETKRIILLMKNLLFLSHGDKEILKNARETVLLADFLMQFVGNRVRFTTDHFAFAIEANPHLLKIAIGNILNNACKYSGEAPVEMQLKGSVLTITDMGIGIPEEEIARVYQPFYRASNTREFAGHGIGLSLSMRILRSYGAEITITSEVGKGTTVEIEFP